MNMSIDISLDEEKVAAVFAQAKSMGFDRSLYPGERHPFKMAVRHIIYNLNVEEKGLFPGKVSYDG